MASNPCFCVLGAYGEHVGKYMAMECLKRGLPTKILCRLGYESFPAKKDIVDRLVASGAEIVFGDASDEASLIEAFKGVDIVISCLGGWGDLVTAHNNVYTACKANGVKRVVPAQFGYDVLSFPESAMDDYFRKKKAWNEAAIASGIPYTIVSQGAFAQWTLSLHNPFINKKDNIISYCGDDFRGWVTTSLEDTSRLTVDCCLDHEMANKRVAIAGAFLSAADMAASLTKAASKRGDTVPYRTQCMKSLSDCERDLADTTRSHQERFNDALLNNWTKGTFLMGFEAPYLIDIPMKYGWTPEGFDSLADRFYDQL